MKIFILFVTVALLLTACAPAVQGFADLPDATETKITALVASVLALVLNFAIARVPWLEFFRKYQAEWSLSISLGLIAALEKLIPDGFADVATKGIDFLLAALLLYVPFVLARGLLVNRGVKGFAK